MHLRITSSLCFISIIHGKPQDFLAKKDKLCEDIGYLQLPLAPLLWVISASKHQTPRLSPSLHTKALKQKKRIKFGAGTINCTDEIPHTE